MVPCLPPGRRSATNYYCAVALLQSSVVSRQRSVVSGPSSPLAYLQFFPRRAAIFFAGKNMRFAFAQYYFGSGIYDVAFQYMSANGAALFIGYAHVQVQAMYAQGTGQAHYFKMALGRLACGLIGKTQVVAGEAAAAGNNKTCLQLVLLHISL